MRIRVRCLDVAVHPVDALDLEGDVLDEDPAGDGGVEHLGQGHAPSSAVSTNIGVFSWARPMNTTHWPAAL
jgi:hypothetical protein